MSGVIGVRVDEHLVAREGLFSLSYERFVAHLGALYLNGSRLGIEEGPQLVPVHQHTAAHTDREHVESHDQPRPEMYLEQRPSHASAARAAQEAPAV